MLQVERYLWHALATLIGAELAAQQARSSSSSSTTFRTRNSSRSLMPRGAGYDLQLPITNTMLAIRMVVITLMHLYTSGGSQQQLAQVESTPCKVSDKAAQLANIINTLTGVLYDSQLPHINSNGQLEGSIKGSDVYHSIVPMGTCGCLVHLQPCPANHPPRTAAAAAAVGGPSPAPPPVATRPPRMPPTPSAPLSPAYSCWRHSPK